MRSLEGIHPGWGIFVVRVMAGIIIANLGVLEEHLRSGAIAAFTQSDIRVRALPLR